MTRQPIDRYTKLLLTVIAAALVVLAVRPWLGFVAQDGDLGIREAHAQPRVPPAPAVPGVLGEPLAGGAAVLPFTTAQPWWDDCSILSKETVPANWGRLVGFVPGAFMFESDDLIRLVRTAPYEAVAQDPSKKPCKVLEIRKTR